MNATYTISYYGNTRTARTAGGAIRAARKMEKLYGQGNRAATIEARTETDAAELRNMQLIANDSHYVGVAGSVFA